MTVLLVLLVLLVWELLLLLLKQLAPNKQPDSWWLYKDSGLC